MTTRSHASTNSQPAFDPAEVDFDALPDREVERMLFADELDDTSSFWSLPTLAGMSIIGVGVAYLMEQLGIPPLDGFDFSFLVGILPVLAGVVIVLMGVGVLSERSSKKQTIRPSPPPDDAPQEENDSETSGWFSSGPFTLSGDHITRSQRNRKITGVCAGLADYMDVDPTLVRIGFVIGLVATGGNFLLAYLVLTFVIPKEEHLSAKRVRIARDR